MRNLEPFAYFSNRASSLHGFGGGDISPDPNYCFHTPYEPARPGHALFRLTLHGARSHRGELNLRVHSWRPTAMTGEVALVNSTRLDLTGREGEEIVTDVHFMALEGVFYAFYGLFSEASDLKVEALAVTLLEPDAGALISAPLHQRNVTAARLALSPKLNTSAMPSLEWPCSQPATAGQVSALRGGGRARLPLEPQDIQLWQAALAMEVLQQTNMLGEGRMNLLLSPPGDDFAAAMGVRCHTEQDALASRLPPDHRYDEGAAAYDMILAVEQADTPQSHAAGYTLPERMLPLMAHGGMGLAFMAMPGDLGETLWRNFLQQVALRLIGEGHEVMQLTFPRERDWFPFPGQVSSYAFLFRK